MNILGGGGGEGKSIIYFEIWGYAPVNSSACFMQWISGRILNSSCLKSPLALHDDEEELGVVVCG